MFEERMKRQNKNLSLSVFALIVGVSGIASAQTPTQTQVSAQSFAQEQARSLTAPPALDAAPALTAAPVVPTADVQGEVVQLGGSVRSDDNLVRAISTSQAKKIVIETDSELEQARLKAEFDRKEAERKIGEVEGKTPARGGAVAAGPVVGPMAQEVYRAPAPVVRSIYGIGDRVFAEIYVGSDKVVARKGTVLSSGEKVEKIEGGVVHLVKGKTRSKLRVSGSAGG